MGLKMSFSSDALLGGTSSGLGVRTPQLNKVSPLTLASKLAECMSEGMLAACEAIAAKLQAADGVGKAVDILQKFMLHCDMS
mmetsp:Transcript_83935/g.195247  ORF Transcript_83935/g.195247 Transcript_83935/m.195247 type:complete len:82 (+) Transcript_83935:184-429(+)|eukprot:CAMPEP_0171115478 /NCGR_PEP_ID=MMETSP0766_2-20121228/87971_1 /TAXON_ID=439317 /ORGANISM="Gambierdiscus australes, Strain CAWD 149" /LENGTH=81 /DNA_ID=CAMNT_0011577839 /DNA_START=180 /DNA_END=425 /DNA_ORIENTATION=-